MADQESRSPDEVSLSSVLTSEEFGRMDGDRPDPAEEALTKRPSFSIRARLILAFAICFLLPLTISIWAIHVLGRVQEKIRFLEVADDYTMEIQQARRFEKNYLLYGTNLEDAREHALRARELSRKHRRRFLPVVGEAKLAQMDEHIAAYLGLLDGLGAGRSPRAEDKLRKQGGDILALAQDFVVRERRDVDAILSAFRRVPFLFLVTLLVVIVATTAILARHILRTLKRFIGYTERIAAGDFTPITPARRYRDEFCQLAIHVNRMVRELDRQQRSLVETHKLRAMGNLVAGVAHELNNPMNNILLTASVLEEDGEEMEPEERRELVLDLIGEAERTKKIVANLLDYARQSEMRVEPLDVRKAVDECVQLVGNQLRLKKIHLLIDLPEDLPVVHGDRQLLVQVFMNLVLNAVDALPEMGRIRITASTSRREGYLAVDVGDNGPGMPEHVLSRVFEPFFTTKRKGRGTGLGLSVSQGIVRKLGGHITVESEEGRGTTFTVMLPVTTIPSDLGRSSADAGAGADG